MSERSDSQLETLLREHFAAKLDGQLGRASERFLREVGEADTPAPETAPLRLVAERPQPVHEPRRSGWSVFAWSIGLTSGAIAAGMLVVMVLAPMVQRGQPGGQSRMVLGVPGNGADDTATQRTVTEPQPEYEHALSWNTIDQGTVYLDGEVPLRSVVRQANETLRWYDPQRRAHVEMTVPRDEVLLVGYGSQ